MLTTMLQRNGLKTTPGLETRRHGTTREDRDALLEAKDRIAELEEQVALLSSELERKDAVLAYIAEGIGELLPARAPGATDGPRMVAPGEARDGKGAMEIEDKPTLPGGYRVVAVASDAWVLVSPKGLRVAGYRGELDLCKAALDAREHLRRQL